MRRCGEGFNSGVKGLVVYPDASKNWVYIEVNPSKLSGYYMYHYRNINL
jgi:hypothetical protein